MPERMRKLTRDTAWKGARNIHAHYSADKASSISSWTPDPAPPMTAPLPSPDTETKPLPREPVQRPGVRGEGHLRGWPPVHRIRNRQHGAESAAARLASRSPPGGRPTAGFPHPRGSAAIERLEVPPIHTVRLLSLLLGIPDM